MLLVVLSFSSCGRDHYTEFIFVEVPVRAKTTAVEVITFSSVMLIMLSNLKNLGVPINIWPGG
jgi:hypothetical protein